MTSDEINAAISTLENADPKVYESPLGEKIVPYIGWFWRTINFDGDCYHLGILPVIKGFDGNNAERVGFMANNKWDYNYVKETKADRATIRKLLVAACSEPSSARFKAVDDFLQSLLKSRKRVPEEV